MGTSHGGTVPLSNEFFEIPGSAVGLAAPLQFPEDSGYAQVFGQLDGK